MARTPYAVTIRDATPPWLQRTRGARLMVSLAEQADVLIDRMIEGVALRMPGALGPIDPTALALTGRERRIRRGPGEDAETYARRLRTWWDAHRTRGGPYALLGQLRAFFLDWLPVRMDVVYHSGTRRWMDENGVITRDSIVWNADGSGLWAQFWVFFHLPTQVPATGLLLTEGDDTITTEDGDPIVAEMTASPDELTAEQLEVFTAIPREWSAGHIKTVHVVLLWSARRLWDYPQPVPTWDEWGATSTWDEPPVLMEIEA